MLEYNEAQLLDLVVVVIIERRQLHYHEPCIPHLNSFCVQPLPYSHNYGWLDGDP